jgi:hypothetical protein
VQLLLHWIVTVIVLIAPPPGPAYNFVVNLYVFPRILDPLPRSSLLTQSRYTYPGAWINTFVAGGLIYLRLRASERWWSPWQTHLAVPFVFLCLNVFLAVTPFVPPAEEDWDADGYPYWLFPTVGTGVIVLGVLYWWVAVRGWEGEKRDFEDEMVQSGLLENVDEEYAQQSVLAGTSNLGRRVEVEEVTEPLLRQQGTKGYDTII